MADWAAGFILAVILVMLARADVRAMILPDALNGLLAFFGLAFALGGGPPALFEAAAGALLGGSLLWLVRALHMRLRGEEGLGLGDVKLVAASGLWIGPSGLPLMLLVATTSAIFYLLFATLRGRSVSRATAIPFGPFLCLGAATAWVAPRLIFL